MHFRNRSREQKPYPEELIRTRKQLAKQHYEQIRVTVHAMLRRGVKLPDITVSAVAKEAHVSVATIYRRDDLFTLIQQANPTLQRRVTTQVYHQSLRELQGELEKARAEVVAAQKEAQLAKLSERLPQQEIIQLKKTLIALQRQVASLEALLARCTCGLSSRGTPS